MLLHLVPVLQPLVLQSLNDIDIWIGYGGSVLYVHTHASLLVEKCVLWIASVLCQCTPSRKTKARSKQQIWCLEMPLVGDCCNPHSMLALICWTRYRKKQAIWKHGCQVCKQNYIAVQIIVFIRDGKFGTVNLLTTAEAFIVLS